MKSCFLGIDLGTSAVKAVLIDIDGQLIGKGEAGYSILHPAEEKAEQDPASWWISVIEAVGQATQNQLNRTRQLAAIGICGQMHGTLLLDRDLRPLHPAVIWPDQRTIRQVQELSTTIGFERLIEITGSPLAAGFQAATLLWFQQNCPHIWAQAAHILLPDDALRLWLSGELSTDPSDASGTLLFDSFRRRWSPDLLAALQTSEAWLPKVQPSTAVIGHLTQQTALELKLTPDVSIVNGAADQAAALLGAGALHPTKLLVNLSSGGQIVQPSLDFQIDRSGRMHTFCSAFEPSHQRPGWYKMAATLSAGMSLRWLKEQVFNLEGTSSDAYDRIMAWAAQSPPGAKGLLFLPHLAGERAPHMDAQARGAFVGLTLQHGKEEIARAVLEGVAFSLYQAWQVLRGQSAASPSELILAGGGARSALWRQIIADVFGAAVVKLNHREQSAIGAALLAAAGTGYLDLAEASSRWASYSAPCEPDPAKTARYQQLLDLYTKAYQQNIELFHLLGYFPYL